MTTGLGKEISRINRMLISAGERSDLVARAKRVAECIEGGPAPTEEWLGEQWCKRCGFAVETHVDLRSRIVMAEGKVR